MIVLSKEQVLQIHARLIETTGGSDGIRDERIRFNHLAGTNCTRAFRQRRRSFVLAW